MRFVEQRYHLGNAQQSILATLSRLVRVNGSHSPPAKTLSKPMSTLFFIYSTGVVSKSALGGFFALVRALKPPQALFRGEKPRPLLTSFSPTLLRDSIRERKERYGNLPGKPGLTNGWRFTSLEGPQSVIRPCLATCPRVSSRAPHAEVS